MTPYELYERCNETELYQIARAAGLAVLPSASKDELIKYILGEEQPPPVSSEFDEWRLAIMRFVIEHRKTLEVQLRCPAKSMDPRACFQCVDQQVVSCLVENKGNLNLIQLHRKPIEPIIGDSMTTTTVLNPENAPRDKEKLKAAGSFRLRRLAESLGMLDTPEQVMAFGQTLPDQRADDIFKRLLEWDAQKKGGAAPANGNTANAAPAPAATADAPGASVAAVDPGAFKAATDATAAGPGVAKRTPKVANGASTGSPEDLGALVAMLDAIKTSAANQGTVVSGAIGELKTAVTGLGTSIEGKIDGLQKAIVTAMNAQTDLLKVTLAVVLTIAEERGIASQAEILEAAVGDAGTLEALLKQAKGAAGKAA